MSDTPHKMVNGKKVPLTKKEIRAEKQKELLHNKKISSVDFKNRQIQRKRAKQYPAVTDQLDAILKQFNYMRMEGLNLVEDCDKIVGQWLKVKRDNPKIEE